VNTSHLRIEKWTDSSKLRRPNTRVLKLIQDVKTRWSATVIMLVRAYKLKDVCDHYTKAYSEAKMLNLNPTEWKQIEYLIECTKPFAFFTSIVSTTKEPTIGLVYLVYQLVFDYLEKTLFHLEQKAKCQDREWAGPMHLGCVSAKEKLKKYYDLSYGDLGSLYAIGSLLTPGIKCADFQKDPGMQVDDQDWIQIYKGHFRRCYEDQGYAARDVDLIRSKQPARQRQPKTLLGKVRGYVRRNEHARLDSDAFSDTPIPSSDPIGESQSQDTTDFDICEEFFSLGKCLVFLLIFFLIANLLL
jgi:hypothetical protein